MEQQSTNSAPKKRTKPDWTAKFLRALAKTGNIKASCAAVGIDRSRFYQRRDSDSAFAAAAAAALEDSTDDLELEARRRAQDGLMRVKFHQGMPIMVPVLDADGRPVMTAQLGADGQPDLSLPPRPLLEPYAEHEYSDTLLIFLLKAHRPEKYRERFDVRTQGNIQVTRGFDLAELTDAELEQYEALLDTLHRRREARTLPSQ